MKTYTCECCGYENKYFMFDMYSIADRMMDGVQVKITFEDSGEAVVHWDEEPYLINFNKEFWAPKAKQAAEKWDIFSCEKCNWDIPSPNLEEPETDASYEEYLKDAIEKYKTSGHYKSKIALWEKNNKA